MNDHGYVVRPAVGLADHEAVYRGRHTVYVEEMGAMGARPFRRIRDRFDTQPHTLNLVADKGGVLGGARFVLDDGGGTTADRYFDFRPHLPEGAWVGAGSMLWMLPAARGTPGLIREMMDVGHRWLAEQGATHVLATVNPPVAPRFARVGYRSIGEPFLHGPDALPVQPMVLETGVEPHRQAA